MDNVIVGPLANGVLTLTLNRPDRLNALTHELVAELHDALDEVDADPKCRVVIVTGAGRGFCAGLDLHGAGPPPGASGRSGPVDGMKGQEHIASLIPHMRAVRKPIITAVNGPAAGGGLALALGADIRVASTSASFNVAFVKVGLSGCDVGVSYLLPRLVGASRAFELMLTGRVIDAAEAEAMGLVSRVVSDDDLMEAARSIAAEIVANSPFGVAMTKQVMWSNLEVSSLQAAIDLENRTQVMSSFTGDMEVAVRAFREKRAPMWEG